MGFRTVIVINNDRLDEVKDPVLKDAVLGWWSTTHLDGHGASSHGPYRVVEQTHNDHTSLISILHMKGEVLSTGYWNDPDYQLNMLKQAANKLGYKVIKKPVRKS